MIIYFHILILLGLQISVSAQITTSTTRGTRDQAATAEVRVKEIISKSGISFNHDLLSLKDNRRPEAGEDFDKSVEIFLIRC